MNIFFDANKEYPIVRTSATLEDLHLKASFLPEGPDIFRMTPDEIKDQFEAGPSFYHHNDTPLDLQHAMRSGLVPLVGERQEPTEEEVVDAIIERANEEIWKTKKGTEVVGSKVIRRVRQSENINYAHRWTVEKARGVQFEVFVLPDLISIDGLRVAVSGRYNPGTFEYIPPPGTQSDPNGWLLMANAEYDFDGQQGTIIFSND